MWKHRLCLNINENFGVPADEQVRLFKDAGFDAFFLNWKSGDDMPEFLRCMEAAKETEMILQSVHSPFGRAKDMWGEDEEKGNAAVEQLLACLADCVTLGAPIMIVHAFIGFKDHTPTAQGLKRYGLLVSAAEKCGVKIAFENTEGEEYLDALMKEFHDSPAVGFCWDTGHEMCYNHSQDLLAKYGDKLIATHLNDNLGIRDYNGEITWLDDLHLLPFDGIADWDDIARRLNRCGYDGILTFELNVNSKPGRFDNEKYGLMETKHYIAECFNRACRVAARRNK